MSARALGVKSRIITVILMIAAAVAFGASPASASGENPRRYVPATDSSACLDSNHNGNVYLIACNGGAYQVWTGWGSPMVNNATGRCLDSNHNGDVYTLPCNGGNYQNWTESWTSIGRTLRNNQTGRCLGKISGNVRTVPCDTSVYGYYIGWYRA